MYRICSNHGRHKTDINLTFSGIFLVNFNPLSANHKKPQTYLNNSSAVAELFELFECLTICGVDA